jgi:TolA-binding protein
MNFFYVVLIMLVTGSIYSCSGESPKTLEEPVAKNSEASVAASADVPMDGQKAKDALKVSDEVFLQQARLMSRMGEIEDELKRQREKIRLLEQGLLTGIAPDGLKKSSHDHGQKLKTEKSAHLDDVEGQVLSAPIIDELNLKVAESHSADSNTDDSNSDVNHSRLNDKFRLVQDLYQASRFGVAISELAAISRQFGENAGEGKLRVWLGKSYARLREFSTARVELEAYLKGWPSGSDVADVRLELAKVYAGLGLKERARGELRQVMKDFPGQESSDIASAEFSKMQGGL